VLSVGSWLVALFFGALIGIALGLLGGGGSILTVPVFVYVLKMPAKEAIAMSLPVVGIASLIGALGHWRAGNVQVRTAAVFGAVAMVAAFAGARMSGMLPGRVQLVLLALVMLGAATSMLRSAARAPGSPATDERVFSPALVAAALGVGTLTGLIGVGGGFLIVPALVVLAHVPIHKAVGTSLLVIAVNTATAFAGQPARGTVRVALLASFTAAAVAGILIGTRLSPKVPAARLKRAFALFLIVLSLLILASSGMRGGAL
jgi:uncharacterized membrane protein YfcA